MLGTAEQRHATAAVALFSSSSCLSDLEVLSRSFPLVLYGLPFPPPTSYPSLLTLRGQAPHPLPLYHR